MKQIRSILSATFIILVLFSSSSFMVGIHLCGGQPQNVALFTKADACEMEKRMPPCHKPQAKPCCEDETILHQGENFNISITEVSIAPYPTLDIALPEVMISEVIPSSPVSRTHFYNYDPPLRTVDLTISHQVFLI
jgi:hypothetical protein